MYLARTSLITALALLGCKGEGNEKQATGSAATPASTGSAAGSSSPEVRAAGSGSSAGSGVAQPPDDPKVREAYHQGMRKGRKAAAAKNYKDAIAGFDEALAAKKNDPRALGERGFVRLLEGTDLDGATKDFDLAAGGTKDPKLLSEIWFNRGLVEEKRGKADNALAAFAIANTLRPTKAAQAKLGTKPACHVTSANRDDLKAIAGADWLALGTAMAHSDDSKPTTAAEALTWLTGGTEPTLPAIVAATDVFEHTVWVVWKNGANLRAVPVATAMGGRCSGRADGKIITASATHIHVRASEELEGGSTYVCQGKGDEIVPCEDKPGEVSLGTACLGGTTTLRDLVVELSTGKVVALIEQPEANPATVKLVATGLEISGNGCDRTEPFAK